MRSLALIIITCLSFMGCGSTMAAINIPGETSASLALRADIVKMIRRIEKAQAPGCSPKVVNTQVISMENNAVNEVWIINSCNKPILYTISLMPDGAGGTFFSINAPDKEAREKM